MLAVLAMLVVLSACMYGVLNYTATVSRNVVGSNAMRRSTEVGDGALDYMFSHWRELMKEQPSALPPSKTFATIPLPTQALFPAVSNFTASRGANPATGTKYTIANYLVQAVDPQMNALSATPLTDTTTVPTSTGMSADQTTTSYLASADVTLPAYGGRMVTVKLRRVFQKQITSPWQYAIFYNDLLEMHPGAAQTITGWVHTNGSLYSAHGGNLTFMSKVDYGNDWAIDYAPGDLDHTGDTKVTPSYPNNLPPARGQIQLPFGMDPTQIFTATNPNNTNYSELIQPPVAGFPDPIASSRYYTQADIHIMVDGSNTVVMTDNAGTTINSSSTGNDLALYNTFKNAITTGDSIQDNREGSTMRIVTLDVSKITSALTPTSSGGTGYLTGAVFKGIVYIADTSGTASVKRGVRLKNGASLAGGLTVASQNPVYIQGDYNTGQTASLTTPANTANNSTGNNVVSGYVEQPAAVLADAVTILSNAWQDSDGAQDLTSNARNATPTTVNTAIVAGIVPTGTAGAPTNAQTYSGGAENFPRFLEDWGGQTFTYYGSMVELYKSQQSVGFWGRDNVYNPPLRNWHFDTLFYTKPPPGSLQIVTYVKQRWYVQ